MEKVLMIFEGKHCAPCKALDMEMLNAALNVDEIQMFEDSLHMDVFKEFNVRSVPTLIIIQDGEEKARTTGFMKRSKIEEFVNSEYQ